MFYNLCIVLSDEIKADAKQTIENLNKLGIITKMFTGDSKQIAEDIAKKVGISEVKYEMLPQDKYAKLEEELENNKTGSKIVTLVVFIIAAKFVTAIIIIVGINGAVYFIEFVSSCNTSIIP